LKKTELAIGDSTELEISYTNRAATTRETKYVEVSSNDTTSGYNRLEITADVKSKPDTLLLLKYSPYTIEFIEEKGGVIKERKVEFNNSGKEEYKLKIIDYPKELFEVKLSQDILKPGKAVELKVKPLKKLPPDTFKQSVTLQVKGKKEFRITIPIKKEKPPEKSLPPIKWDWRK
jgi:rRNA maturation protein Rpf1